MPVHRLLAKAALLCILITTYTLIPLAKASSFCPDAGFVNMRDYKTDILQRMQVDSDAKVLVVGDSIAERWVSLPDQIGRPVENWGASGDKPEDLLWRLHQVRQRRHWALVILIVGVNSAFRSPTCKTIAGAIQADVAELANIDPYGKIIVVGVMPYQPGLVASLAQIDPINQQLAAEARTGQYLFVNPGAALKRACLYKQQCPLLIDWLHPSAAGYKLIWETVKSYALAN